MDYLLSLAAALGIGIGQVCLWRRRVGAPDPTAGDWEEYHRAASGAAPKPFCWRWLIPALCGSNPKLWRASTLLSLALLPPALVFFLHGWGVGGPLSWILTAACLTTVPAIYERNMKVLHLVDAPALLLTILSAGASVTPSPVAWFAIPLAILSGSTRETAPIFAALWSANPMLLLGLLGIPLWRKGTKPWRHLHLYEKTWETFGRQRWQHGFYLGYLTGWGAFIPAWPGALQQHPILCVGALAMASLPLFRSVDTMRLLIPWVLPILALSICQLSPGALLATLLLGIVLSSQWAA